jgi:hypothetical protein
MKNIVYKPQNELEFFKLIAFARTLDSACRELSVQPVAYGSLAYAFHTQDQSITVNDIDLLEPESSFQKILTAFDSATEIKCETTTYHCLKLFRDGVEVSFDAIERYYIDLPHESVTGKINGCPFEFVSKDALIVVYKRAAKTIESKRDSYIMKLRLLTS